MDGTNDQAQTTPATEPTTQSASPATSAPAPAAAAPAASTPGAAAPASNAGSNASSAAVAPKPPIAAPVDARLSTAYSAEIHGEFDRAKYVFGSKPYRIVFKNGNSGEYSGDLLNSAVAFPFAADQIASIQAVEEVGTEID